MRRSANMPRLYHDFMVMQAVNLEPNSKRRGKIAIAIETGTLGLEF
jgi:hypothetical protein